MLLTAGNLSEAIGIDKLVAFFASDPTRRFVSPGPSMTTQTLSCSYLD